MPFISQSNFLQALGWAVINSLWQMALLWLIYKVYVFVIKPGSSSKSKSAFILLVGGTVWFITTFIIAFNKPITETYLFSWNNATYSLNDSISFILPYASILYLLILAIPVSRFIVSFYKVRELRTKKLKKIEVQWRLFVKKMSDYLEIRKPVQVWISENITSPVTVGFLKPIILVPLVAINQLSPRQMEAVLLHELAHIKRYDYLLNIITIIIKTIFYFNPFTRNLANSIDAEREKSCDEWVLQYQYDAYSYSSALLALEQMKKDSLQLALAAVASRRELLLERIRKIMGLPHSPVYSIKNRMSWLTGIIGSALLFVILFANALKRENAAAKTDSYPFAYLKSNNNPDINWNAVGSKHLAKSFASNNRRNAENNSENESASSYEFLTNNLTHFTPVNFLETVAPELNKEQELQVQEAVDASKRILEERRWNEVKSSVADALTEAEKQNLKQYYEKELSKLDWEKLEEKLRLSYNQINWNTVNAKMNQEIAAIKLDSITNVYSYALNNVIKAKQELQKECLKGIPDTDITIAGLDSAKVNLSKTLNQLKAAKQKKIIHL